MSKEKAPTGTQGLALDSSGNYIPLAGLGMSSAPSSGFSLPTLFFPYFPIPQSGTLYNSTQTAFPISNIALQSLTGFSEFTQTNNCGSSIAPGSSCTIHVTSNRVAEGGTQELLTLTSGTNLYTTVLDDSLFPVINFGDTALSSTSAGTEDSYPLVGQASGFTDISGVIAENPWTSFSISQCATPAGICLAEVNFTPTELGPQTGNLSLDPNSGLRATQYIVVGTGVTTEAAAKLLLKQTGFATGFTPLLGTYGVTQGAFTLLNLGSHTVHLTGPALSGSDPQNFTFGAPTCSQPAAANSAYPSIAKGSQCTIPLTFSGTQTGLNTATAAFTDTTSGLTFNTPLYLGILANPILSPSSLSFPATSIFSVSAPQSITVTRDISHPVTSTTSGNLIAIKGSCAAGEAPCLLTFAFAPTGIADFPAATISDATLRNIRKHARHRHSPGNCRVFLRPGKLVRS